MYEIKNKDSAKKFKENTQLYQIIFIDDKKLRFRSYTAVGELYDEFILKKRIGKPNLLVEMNWFKNSRQTRQKLLNIDKWSIYGCIRTSQIIKNHRQKGMQNGKRFKVSLGLLKGVIVIRNWMKRWSRLRKGLIL